MQVLGVLGQLEDDPPRYAAGGLEHQALDLRKEPLGRPHVHADRRQAREGLQGVHGRVDLKPLKLQVEVDVRVEQVVEHVHHGARTPGGRVQRQEALQADEARLPLVLAHLPHRLQPEREQPPGLLRRVGHLGRGPPVADGPEHAAERPHEELPLLRQRHLEQGPRQRHWLVDAPGQHIWVLADHRLEELPLVQQRHRQITLSSCGRDVSDPRWAAAGA
mmetsp:Transcript_104850/g.284745  ORF Transcript_104850/g.284745 Transcript_104850/m.284745 type:complete len:219 (-) Transcript_104850:21-677(-)